MNGSTHRYIHGVYDLLYSLFPHFAQLLYRIHYLIKFEDSGVYFDKPAGSFKRLSIGRNSLSSGIIKVITFTPSQTEIKVGSYTRFGERCYIMANTRHTPRFISNHMNNLLTKKFNAEMESLYLSKRTNKSASVSIGSDVWIGTDVKIIGNRKIGDGAVIGTGAVVTKDVAPYEIVGGVPAQRIGLRFSKETITKLLKIKWWEWDESKIKENASDFYDPSKFVKKWSR